MSQRPNEPVLPVEPDAGADGSEDAGFDFYEYDKRRRDILKETLGVTLRLSQVQYTGADGELVTESYKDYARRALIARYPTLETFLTAWFQAEHKQSIVAELYHLGIFMDKLQEELGTDLDAFDLICHLAFGRVALTRRERANQVRSQPGYFEKYGRAARQVLDVVLAKFSEDGYMTLDKVLDEAAMLEIFLSSPPLYRFGRPSKVMRAFGGRERFRQAMRDLQDILYQD